MARTQSGHRPHVSQGYDSLDEQAGSLPVTARSAESLVTLSPTAAAFNMRRGRGLPQPFLARRDVDANAQGEIQQLRATLIVLQQAASPPSAATPRRILRRMVATRIRPPSQAFAARGRATAAAATASRPTLKAHPLPARKPRPCRASQSLPARRGSVPPTTSTWEHRLPGSGVPIHPWRTPCTQPAPTVSVRHRTTPP